MTDQEKTHADIVEIRCKIMDLKDKFNDLEEQLKGQKLDHEAEMMLVKQDGKRTKRMEQLYNDLKDQIEGLQAVIDTVRALSKFHQGTMNEAIYNNAQALEVRIDQIEKWLNFLFPTRIPMKGGTPNITNHFQQVLRDQCNVKAPPDLEANDLVPDEAPVMKSSPAPDANFQERTQKTCEMLIMHEKIIDIEDQLRIKTDRINELEARIIALEKFSTAHNIAINSVTDKIETCKNRWKAADAAFSTIEARTQEVINEPADTSEVEKELREFKIKVNENFEHLNGILKEVCEKMEASIKVVKALRVKSFENSESDYFYTNIKKPKI